MTAVTIYRNPKTIGSLPNGATYYDFNDAHELPIDTAQTQNNKQAKYCS